MNCTENVANVLGSLADWAAAGAAFLAVVLSFCAFRISQRQDAKVRAEWQNIRRASGPRFRSAKVSFSEQIDLYENAPIDPSKAIILNRSDRRPTTEDSLNIWFGTDESLMPIYILLQNQNGESAHLIDWVCREEGNGEEVRLINFNQGPFFLLKISRDWGGSNRIKIEFETKSGFFDVQTYEIRVFEEGGKLVRATAKRIDPSGVDHDRIVI